MSGHGFASDLGYEEDACPGCGGIVFKNYLRIDPVFNLLISLNTFDLFEGDQELWLNRCKSCFLFSVNDHGRQRHLTMQEAAHLGTTTAPVL